MNNKNMPAQAAQAGQAIDIEVAGHSLRLFAQRAVLLQQASCLLIADLHLGKADTFRQHGIALPQSVQTADLARLERLLALARPRRCVVLGDFLHGPSYGDDTVQAWCALVAAHPTTAFELVLGNHDRVLDAQRWQLTSVVPELQIGNVLLTHEPVAPQALRDRDVALNVHGHIHPAWRYAGWYEKLPALVHQAPHLILPAFSDFTAGVAQRIETQQIWIFIDRENTVVRVN